MCGGDKTPSESAWHKRTMNSVNRGQRSGTRNHTNFGWVRALRDGGPRGWLRHVFLDLEGHAPGCRWVSFWTAVTGRA